MFKMQNGGLKNLLASMHILYYVFICRKKLQLVGNGRGKYENLYGLTRFGPAHPPSAIIISRHELRDRREPGPGEYDPHKIPDS